MQTSIELIVGLQLLSNSIVIGRIDTSIGLTYLLEAYHRLDLIAYTIISNVHQQLQLEQRDKNPTVIGV